jgi:AcrR family transcriptional regulator
MSTQKSDRRVERTRESVLSAFRSLFFERGYEAISVQDIIERANVGRSTFYDHFQNKDEVLHDSLTPVLLPLAQTLDAHDLPPQLAPMLEHMRENAASSKRIFETTSRNAVARLLAALIEERMNAIPYRHAAGAPQTSRAVAARFLADVQLAIVGRWIVDDERCPRDTVAQTLLAATSAAAATLRFA